MSRTPAAKFVYFGGPMDGETFDAEESARTSGVMLQEADDTYIPIQIGMSGGSYVPDYGFSPPRLVWRQAQP